MDGEEAPCLAELGYFLLQEGDFSAWCPGFPKSIQKPSGLCSTGRCPARGSTGKSALLAGGPRLLALEFETQQNTFATATQRIMMALKTGCLENPATLYNSALYPEWLFHQTKAEGVRSGRPCSLHCILRDNAKNIRLILKAAVPLFNLWLAVIWWHLLHSFCLTEKVQKKSKVEKSSQMGDTATWQFLKQYGPALRTL